ncbi:hypothetical protein FB562_1962 [Homoserinimonas aerilata]|uniref:Galactose mutarotase-like enzyme n=1 Tax=Homoserinimonas aerilata TaxID=1162970 RepID=A0A542YL90_9MICO|nr:hypothetical protein [Homoserinimonas aerilata]TQL48856.1 hypothetical protein FB562_1962 [Homoserinimonas aerilata]
MTVLGFTLVNGLLAVECHPAHGFVISTIRRNGDGTNLLWMPEGASLGPLSGEIGPSGIASIATFDGGILAGGWFTMFPTAGLPGDDQTRWMHGEAARLPWEVQTATSTSLACVVLTRHFIVRREVALTSNEVRVTTTATNTSGETQAVTFGEHPCFSRSLYSGGQLELRAISATSTSTADIANSTLRPENAFEWPNAPRTDGGVLDLAAIPVDADGRHDHVGLTIPDGAAAIRDNNGNGIELSWGASKLPHALLWQHFRPEGSPWANGDVFAVEPSSAPGRTFSESAAAGGVTTVDAEASVSWWTSLRVG